MSGIIPKERLGSYKRWQIGEFDGPKQGPLAARSDPAPSPSLPADQTAPPVALPTAEEIESMYEAARQAGYEAGLEEARQAGEFRVQQAVSEAIQQAAQAQAERFGSLFGTLQDALSRLDQEIGEQLLELAVEIAAQVIRGNIALRSDVLLPVIREAIAALPVHHGHISLRLNPADAIAVRESLGDHLAQLAVQIVEDATLSPGGCQVRAGASEVDASIETRWRRVLEAIGAEPTAWLNS